MRLPPKNPRFSHGVPRTICDRSVNSKPFHDNEEDNVSLYDFSAMTPARGKAAAIPVDNDLPMDDLLDNHHLDNEWEKWENSSDDMSLYTFDDETIYTDFQSNPDEGVFFEGIPEDAGRNLKKKRKKAKKHTKKEAAAVREEIQMFLSASKSFKEETQVQKAPPEVIKFTIKESTSRSSTPSKDAPKVKDLVHVWNKEARVQKRKDAKVKKLISTYNSLHSTNNSIMGCSVASLSSRSTKNKRLPPNKKKRFAVPAVFTTSSTAKKKNKKNPLVRSSPDGKSKPKEDSSGRGLLKKTYRGLATILEQSNVTPSNNFWKQREETQKKEKAITKRRGWKFWRSSKRKAETEEEENKPVESSHTATSNSGIIMSAAKKAKLFAARAVWEANYTGNSSRSTTSVTSSYEYEEENLVKQRVREWQHEVREETDSVCQGMSAWC